MVKSLNRKEKRKQGSLKKKKSTKNKYQLASMPASIKIIKESKEQFNEMLKSTDRPLLNRLFRKDNINKLDSMPDELTDISKYSSRLKKEFADLKRNKKNQPNQDLSNASYAEFRPDSNAA